MGKDLKGRDLGVGIYQHQDGLYSARYTNKLGKRKEKYFCEALAIRKQNGYTKDKGGDCYGTNIKCICTSGT